jgi:DNA replication protein DnaD
MGFDSEAIYHAYDITVLKTGGLKWGYMNSILKSWHDKNLHTLKEIEREDRPPASATLKGRPEKTDRPGDYERKTIEWLMNYKPAGKQGK